ncbi:hypothetical protein NM208_g12735 [Fusarium decemcellulare]|uniref:Uncharacterized protein n=1 Tax=Fusarium decemcellulare TaxID=57161 RepID=A0ACC1RPH0_9HYPO|nr:hypothetical protein NM208_g12735 [Fusarium decemcellulare]
MIDRTQFPHNGSNSTTTCHLWPTHYPRGHDNPAPPPASSSADCSANSLDPVLAIISALALLCIASTVILLLYLALSTSLWHCLLFGTEASAASRPRPEKPHPRVGLLHPPVECSPESTAGDDTEDKKPAAEEKAEDAKKDEASKDATNEEVKDDKESEASKDDADEENENEEEETSEAGSQAQSDQEDAAEAESEEEESESESEDDAESAISDLTDLSDREMEIHVIHFDGTVSDSDSDSDSASEAGDDEEKDPWNAVVVAGLRVFHKGLGEGDDDSSIDLKVIRPIPFGKDNDHLNPENQGKSCNTKVLDVDDSAKDATLVGDAKDKIRFIKGDGRRTFTL